MRDPKENSVHDSVFWQICLGCTARWTTIDELANLYGKTSQSFYGENGPLAQMVRSGALRESERMKRTYRTVLDSNVPWSEVLEPAYISFFSHAWLKYLIKDKNVLATKADEIFVTIRTRIVTNMTSASEAFVTNNIASSIQHVIDTKIKLDFVYPEYFSNMKLFDALIRLRALLHFYYASKNRKPEFFAFCTKLDDAETACAEANGTYTKECIELVLSGFKEFGLTSKMASLLEEQMLEYLKTSSPEKLENEDK